MLSEDMFVGNVLANFPTSLVFEVFLQDVICLAFWRDFYEYPTGGWNPSQHVMEFKMKIFVFTVVTTCLLTLSGCASAPKADKASEQYAKAFSPKKGQSNIYVYHPRNFDGGGLNYRVTLDNQVVGELSNGTFILLELTPGRHQLVVNNIANFIQPELFSPIITLSTEKEENYFFNTGLIVKSGYMNLSDENGLQLVSDAEGREGVSNCDMALVSDSIKKSVAEAAQKRREQANKLANFPSPSKLTPPSPIRGNGGKYMSPFTSTGTVASWAEDRSEENNFGYKMATVAAESAIDSVGPSKYVPITGQISNILGHRAKLEIRHLAEVKKIEAYMAKVMEEAKTSSDISFNSIDDFAVYLYVKNSTHSGYARVLKLAQKIYPELEQRYIDAVDKAAHFSKYKKHKL